MTRLFSFPDTVHETSARVVASGVVAMGVAFIATGSGWFLLPLVYGFAARVLAGPALSPLGQLATRVITPRLPGPHREVPGAPKRFAQGIGLAFSSTAALAQGLSFTTAATGIVVCLVAAASLEAAASICLGCIVYRRFWGCADCDNLAARWA